jgi:hypothetical protein
MNDREQAGFLHPELQEAREPGFERALVPACGEAAECRSFHKT